MAQVSLTQNIAPPDANAGPNLILPCDLPTTTLQGSSSTPGVLFGWQTDTGNFVSGQNSPTPFVDAPGLYTLTVSDPANGCTASSSMTVLAPQPDFPMVLSSAPDCIQPTGSILFNGGQGPFLYSIDNGATLVQDSLFEDLLPGMYQTLVQDAAGCEQQQVVTLPGVTPLVISLSQSDTLAPGSTIQLSPQLNIPTDSVATIVWTPAAGLSCSDCLNPTVLLSISTNYTVTVIALNGCTASATIALIVRATSEVYLPNVFSPNLDGVNDLFLVQTALAVQNFDLQIFDRWGDLLFQSSDINTGWDGRAKDQAMNPGVYAYLVRFNFIDGAGQVQAFLASGDVLLVR